MQRVLAASVGAADDSQCVDERSHRVVHGFKFFSTSLDNDHTVAMFLAAAALALPTPEAPADHCLSCITRCGGRCENSWRLSAAECTANCAQKECPRCKESPHYSAAAAIVEPAEEPSNDAKSRAAFMSAAMSQYNKPHSVSFGRRTRKRGPAPTMFTAVDGKWAPVGTRPASIELR